MAQPADQWSGGRCWEGWMFVVRSAWLLWLQTEPGLLVSIRSWAGTGASEEGVNDNRCAQARGVNACAWRKGGAGSCDSKFLEMGRGAAMEATRPEFCDARSSRFDGHGSSALCPPCLRLSQGDWPLRLRSGGPLQNECSLFAEFPGGHYP